MTARVRDRKGIVSSTYMSFIGVRLSIRKKDFVILGCGTYFIEDNALQYSTVVIIYDNTLYPPFASDRRECCYYCTVLYCIVLSSIKYVLQPNNPPCVGCSEGLTGRCVHIFL